VSLNNAVWEKRHDIDLFNNYNKTNVNFIIIAHVNKHCCCTPVCYKEGCIKRPTQIERESKRERERVRVNAWRNVKVK